MDIHKNARLTPLGRERAVGLVLGGQTPQAVSAAVGVSPRTVRKWVKRFEVEGLAGLTDRSSRPHRLYRPTPQAMVDRIEGLRRQRLTGKAIATATGVSAATVSRVLKRLGLSRLNALEPAEPVRRYQRERPGELLHLDIKKLGRFNTPGHRVRGQRSQQWRNRRAGWEFVHVAIDDASRVAFSRVMQTERQHCAVAFLKAAVTYYASLGIAIERVMTDNGACYRSHAFQRACKRLGLRIIYTRPYTPKTNGKAERFIQTALREWAYAKTYASSRQRAADLPYWIHRYNWHRPHGGIQAQTPISTLGLAGNNLLRLHS
jgi:transposase InsO family protein